MPRTKRRTVERQTANLNKTENITIANNNKSIKTILDDFEIKKKEIEDSLYDSLNNSINVIENAFMMVKLNLSNSLQSNLYEYIDMMDSNPVKSGFVLDSTKSVNPSGEVMKTATNMTTRQPSASKMDLQCINAPISHKNLESQYNTPVNRPNLTALMPVTPKINMNEPMSMMRRPNQGEVAISMTGSPLMISSVTRDDMVTASVPLANGNIISILPRTGASMDVSFNEQTKKELLLLKENIEKLLLMRQIK